MRAAKSQKRDGPSNGADYSTLRIIILCVSVYVLCQLAGSTLPPLTGSFLALTPRDAKPNAAPGSNEHDSRPQEGEALFVSVVKSAAIHRLFSRS